MMIEPWMQNVGGGLLAVLFFVLWPAYLGARSENEDTKEWKQNDRDAEKSPTDHQIRWHIRHIRSDLRLLCFLLMTTNLLLFFVAFNSIRGF